jgi:hypothetical protein
MMQPSQWIVYEFRSTTVCFLPELSLCRQPNAGDLELFDQLLTEAREEKIQEQQRGERESPE